MIMTPFISYDFDVSLGGNGSALTHKPLSHIVFSGGLRVLIQS